MKEGMGGGALEEEEKEGEEALHVVLSLGLILCPRQVCVCACVCLKGKLFASHEATCRECEHRSRLIV